MRWFWRAKTQAPTHAQAVKRAQASATQDLQYWAAVTLPAVQRQLTADTTLSLEEAEMYVLSLYEIVRELRRRKELDASIFSKSA